jgi:Ni,Fe-hydrogenase I small subunit
VKKEYHNAIFDERFDLLPEYQQELINIFFGSSCYAVAEAVVIWMMSMDCSGGARSMILDYKNEYKKLMDEYASMQSDLKP